MVLRAFLVADARRLRRHARRARAASRRRATRSVVSNQRGGVSKDVWVLGVGARARVEPAGRRRAAAGADARRPATCPAASPTISSGSAATPSAPRAARALLREVLLPRARPRARAARRPALPLLLRAVTAVTATLSRLHRRRAPTSACAAPGARAAAACCFDRRRAGSAALQPRRAGARRPRRARSPVERHLARHQRARPRARRAARARRRARSTASASSCCSRPSPACSAESMSRGQGWRFLEIGRHARTRAHRRRRCCARSCPAGHRARRGAAGRRCSPSPTRR